MPDTPPILLPVKDVAARLCVCTHTVRRLIRDGSMPSVMVGGSLRIPAYYVDELASVRSSTNAA